MVLVFSNSKDRAMLLASAIDAVILRNKKKVRLANFFECREEMAKEFDVNGSIKVFFRGEPYVFICSEGMPCALKRMSDYNPEYAKLKNRPIPYYPEESGYRFNDPAFEANLPYYKKLTEQASLVINASSDDYEGEISFFQFLVTTNYGGEFFRVRPHFISGPSVIEAFNSLEDAHSRRKVEAACAIKEKFDWLFTCNATNALSAWNYESKAIVAARTECVMLAMINDRERKAAAQSKGGYRQVSLILHNESGSVYHAVSRQRFNEKEAAEIVKSITPGTKITAANEGAKIQSANRLMNMFEVQAKAFEDHGIMPADSIKAMNDLFMFGFISWPSDSKALPWSYKKLFSQIVASSVFSSGKDDEVILPKDVDDFNDWEMPEPLFGHGGIIAIKKMQDESYLSDTHKAIYNLIAASNVDTIKPSSEDNSTVIEFTFRGVNFSVTESPCFAMEFIVDSCKHVNATPEKKHTIASLWADMNEAYKKSFVNDASFFASALDNLVARKQCSISSSGEISVTNVGRLLVKYTKGTLLSDIRSLVSWDERLQGIVSGTEKISEFKADYRGYIQQMLDDIKEKCDEFKKYGGLCKDDIVCPVCGGAMDFHTKNGVACANKCGFVVPNELYGHTFSEEEIVAIIVRGKTDMVHGLKSGKGTYSARFARDGDKIIRSFDYDLPCPFCNSPLSEYGWGLKCKNEGCGFTLNKVVCKHTFSDEDIRTLISMGTTAAVEFVSPKSQKNFTASVYISKDDKTLKFKF